MEVGIITKSLDYKESSKIVYLYTKSGKKEFLAKGCKKINSPYRSFFLNFNVISFSATDSNFPIFIDGDIIESFSNIASSYNKNLCASLVMEVLTKLPEEANEKLFNFVVKILHYINFEKEETYCLIFMIKFLFFLGIAPQFKNCCSQSKNVIGFNIEKGSVICPNCQTKSDLSLDLTIKLANLYTIDIDKEKIELSDEERKELFYFIFSYYNYHLGFVSKLKGYF